MIKLQDWLQKQGNGMCISYWGNSYNVQLLKGDMANGTRNILGTGKTIEEAITNAEIRITELGSTPANLQDSPQQKSPYIVHVHGIDGGGLYVDGKIQSDHFTVGERELLKALGHSIDEERELDPDWYNNIIQLPPALEDCKWKKGSPKSKRK